MGDSLLRTRYIYTAYLAFTTEENTIFFLSWSTVCLLASRLQYCLTHCWHNFMCTRTW